MRVLFVENALGFGGSLTGLLDFIRSLPAEIEPVLASNFDVRPFVELPPSLPYENLDLPQPPPSQGNVLKGLVQLYRRNFVPWRRIIERMANKHRPDIIHVNNGLLINIGAARACHALGIPVVGNQKCMEYSGRLTRFLARRGWYARHIPSSKPVGDELRSLGVPVARLEVVYEPIFAPTEPFVPRYDRPVDVQRPVRIGMCSMLTPWKGQDVFLAAIAALRKATRSPFEVILAGSPPNNDPSYPNRLRDLAKALAIDDLVEFRGHVRDMYGFLPELDISVHASIRPEPFGRIVAESMICGVPVVATAAGGPGDYVPASAGGLSVPMGDAPAMAEALRELVESPELRDDMARRGRAFALREFDPPTIAAKVIAIYNACLGERK